MVKFYPYSTAEAKSVSAYINPRKLFSFGTHTIVIVSGRGRGKTFLAKRYAIPRFHYRGEQFIWVRDNDEARRRLAENKGARFFADFGDMPEKIRKHKSEYSIQGTTILCGAETMGYIIPSNEFQNDKGSSYAKAETVIFDEFIAEISRNSDRHRVWKIINTLSTIMRERGHGKVIFLANALDRSDPLMSLFGFDNIDKFGIYVNREKDVALQYIDTSPAARLQIDNSIVGKLLKGTPYAKNMLDGEFIGDNDTSDMFIDMPSRAALYAVFNSGYDRIALYMKAGTTYVAGGNYAPKSTDFEYVRDLRDIAGNKRLISKELLSVIIDRYKSGTVKFISPHARGVFLEFIK